MDLPTSWPHSVRSLWCLGQARRGGQRPPHLPRTHTTQLRGRGSPRQFWSSWGNCMRPGWQEHSISAGPSHCSIIGSPAHGLFLSRAFLPGEFSSGGASSARLLHPREVMCFLGDALLTHPDWLYISFPCEAFTPIPTNLTSDFFPSSPLSVGYRVSCLILDWWL